jgi:uncharacterized membrane protein YsdA (DUF1294 family)
VLLLVGLLIAAAGLALQRRTGKHQIQKATFVVLLIVLLLGASAALLALIGTAVK